MRPPQSSASFSPSIDLGDLDDLNVGANQRGAPSRLEVDCFHFAVRPSFRWCTLPFLPVE
jgi:hypothetical protein